MASITCINTHALEHMFGANAIAAFHCWNGETDLAERVALRRVNVLPKDFKVGSKLFPHDQGVHLEEFGPFLGLIAPEGVHIDDDEMETLRPMLYRQKPNNVCYADWKKVTDNDSSATLDPDAWYGHADYPAGVRPMMLFPSAQVMMYVLYKCVAHGDNKEPVNIERFTEQLAQNSVLALKFKNAAKQLKEHLLNLCDPAKIDRAPGYAQAQAKWKAQIKAASDEVVKRSKYKDEAVEVLNQLIRERNKELTKLDPNYKNPVLSDAQELASLGLDQSILGNTTTVADASPDFDNSTFDDF